MEKKDMRSFYVQTIHWLEGGLLWLQRIGSVSALFSIGYLLFGLSSGALFYLEDPTRYSLQKQAQLVQTVEFVGTFCTINLLLAVVCSLIRAPDDPLIVGSVIVAGMLSGLGLPLFIGYQARLAPWGHNEATEFLVNLFGRTGALIGGILGLWLFWKVGWQIRSHAITAWTDRNHPFPGKLGSRRPTAFSRCWQLPYCRDFLLAVCPAFQARIKCWKYGRGCFCDQSMNDFLVAKVRSLPSAKEQEALERDISERAAVVSREWKGHRPPCADCPIFLEHQRLKQRFLTPWLFLLTALLAGGNRRWLQEMYGLVSKQAVHLWNQLSFAGDVAVPAAPAAAAGQEAVASAALSILFYIVLVLLGICVFLLLLRLTERALFRWHL